MLAATLHDYTLAQEHFEHALTMNERMGARPWVAHNCHQYGRMMLDRSGPLDSDRAEELLRRALSIARECGDAPSGRTRQHVKPTQQAPCWFHTTTLRPLASR